MSQQLNAVFVSEWEEGEVRTPARIDLDTGRVSTTPVEDNSVETFIRQYAVHDDIMLRLDDAAWQREGELRLLPEDLAVLKSWLAKRNSEITLLAYDVEALALQHGLSEDQAREVAPRLQAAVANSSAREAADDVLWNILSTMASETEIEDGPSA